MEFPNAYPAFVLKILKVHRENLKEHRYKNFSSDGYILIASNVVVMARSHSDTAKLLLDIWNNHHNHLLQRKMLVSILLYSQ